MNIRVRYPPSPTGNQHLGGVRSALFNYFFAKANGGTFVLRIEDTDQTRSTDDAVQDIYDTFSWLGVEWDEGPDRGGAFGPYVQSERRELYTEHVDFLLNGGFAYRCFCTAERLDELRAQQTAEKKPTGYDRKCRNLSANDIEVQLDAGSKFVVRFKVPFEGKTSFTDLLLGEISRKNRDIPVDPILLKSDGLPTYHLANVVDDHLMEISHIMRAQEWLPSVPLHILLYDAFGWNPPQFCHLPMVLGTDGQKLSKRHGSTAIREFRAEGYLPEALLNYISLLGWSLDDKSEFFSREDLCSLFSLEKLNKAPAVFDYKKLQWFNGQYIRKMSDGDLRSLVLPILKKDKVVSDPATAKQLETVDAMMPLVKERLRLLPEISGLVRFLFDDVVLSDPNLIIPKRLDKDKTKEVLAACKKLLANFANQTDEKHEELFRLEAETLGVKLGDFLMPLRLAITGSPASPPLFGAIRLLGEQTALARVESAILLLG